MTAPIGEVIVQLGADVSDLKKAFDDVNARLGGLGTNTVVQGNLMAKAIEFTATKVKDFAVNSVKAYGESEIAILRLSKAVGKDAANALVEFAKQQQKATTFSDDAVVSLETQLANYGILPGSIKSATMALLDYAAATGHDLPEAGMLMGQALAGQGRELKKYGLDLDVNATRSENLARTTKFLEQKFHGVAVELKDTAIGQVENFQNRLNDLQKKLGEEMVPVLKSWAHWLEVGLGWVEKLTGASRSELSVKELGIQKLKAESEQILANAMSREGTTAKTVTLTEAESKRLVMLTREINALKEEHKETKQATDDLGKHKGAVDKDTNALEQRLSALRKSLKDEGQIQAGITSVTQLETESRIAIARNSFEMQASFSQALAVAMIQDAHSWGSIFASMTMQLTDNAAHAFAEILVYGGSFKDAMQKVFGDLLVYFVETVLKKMIINWLASMKFMQATGAAMGLGGGVPVTAGVAPGTGAGGAGMALLGSAAGIAGGAYLGQTLGKNIAGESTSATGAKIGALGGAIVGTALFGPLGGLAGGALGGVVGGSVNKIGKSVRKAFSGGMINEPGIIISESGDIARVGDRGPEALVSFEGDLGINPNQARRRLMGSSGSGQGGGDGLTVVVQGTFLEANPAKWQRMIRTTIVPELRRFSDISPQGPFKRRRGQS